MSCIIHNLTAEDILKMDLDETNNYIHVSTVTRDNLIKTEDILLFNRKTLVMINDEMKIVNFEKSSLLHELNRKYSDLFPELIITTSMSDIEDDNFIHKIPTGTEVKIINEFSKLKLTIKNQSVELLTVSNKLCYNQPELCLSRFLSKKLNHKAIEIELKDNKFDILQAQLIQYKREKDVLEKFLKNTTK